MTNCAGGVVLPCAEMEGSMQQDKKHKVEHQMLRTDVDLTGNTKQS